MSTAPQHRETRPPAATGGKKAKHELSPRRPIAVLLSRFPLVTETFILREVLELERQGQPVCLVPLLKESPEVIHREARPWVEKALYTPFLSRSILLSNLRVMGQRPATYWKLLRQLVLGPRQRLGVRLRTLALFPKSVYLAERLQHEGIRHIHAHYATYPAAVAYIISALTDITYSLTIHAHDIFVGQELLEEKIGAARWVRTISEFNRRYLLDRYPHLPANKLRVIHVGVEPPRRPVPELGLETDTRKPPLILCVAALKPYKGLPVLLQACTILYRQGSEFRCEIVGDGPLRGDLQQTIDRTGLSEVVCLRGPQPQDEVARSMAQASLIVLPSVVAQDGQMEGIPVALMEAMAAERPVVASALSGIPELIEDGVDGLLTTPGDAQELATALASLLADPATAAAMAARGRRRVIESFRLEATVGELLRNLDESNPELDTVIVARSDGTDLSGDRLPRVGVRRVHRQGDSDVAELLLAAEPEPREIVYKTHRSFVGQSRSARIRARDEFHWLGEIDRYLQRASLHEPEESLRFRVPRPLDLFEEEAALSMERCRGSSLLEELKGYRRSPWRGPPAEALIHVHHVGQWLRAFQGLEMATNAVIPVERYLQLTLQTTLEELETHLSPTRISRHSRRLQALVAQIDVERLAFVTRHGDFWPGNIFVDHQLVQVIDFEGLGPGLPYEDLANFTAHLELLFAYPLLRGRGQTLIHRFVEGFLADSVLDTALYRFCRSVALLKLAHRQSPVTLGDPLGAWRRHLLTRESLG